MLGPSTIGESVENCGFPFTVSHRMGLEHRYRYRLNRLGETFLSMCGTWRSSQQVAREAMAKVADSLAHGRGWGQVA